MTEHSGKKAAWNTSFFLSQALSLSDYSEERRYLADGGIEIPNQIHDCSLVKVHPPDADCDHPGKQPIGSVHDTVSVQKAQNWIENGGNIGVATTDDLVILDIDSDQMLDVVDEVFPETFTVSSGNGEHRYFRTTWGKNVKFGEAGSVRAHNWLAVAPPSLHPNGTQYTVTVDAPIVEVESDTIAKLVDELSNRQHTAGRRGGSGSGGSPGGGAGCVGGSSIPSIPEEYPERTGEWSMVKSWLDSNGLLSKVEKTSSSDWSGDEYVVAKCLAEGGFDEFAIRSALDRMHPAAKWHTYRPHNKLEDYRTRTIRNAIVDACEDDYVDFSDFQSAYKTDSSVERRKTESDDPASNQDRSSEPVGHERGDQYMANEPTEFSVKDKVTVKEPSGDAGRFRDVALVEGNDNGDTFEFVQIRKGEVEMMETTDGDEVEVLNVYDRKSLGSPDSLKENIDGLQQLLEKISEEPAAADD